MATVRELVTRWGFEIDDKPLKDLENGIKDVKGSLLAIGAAGAAAGAALFGIAKTTASVGDEAAKSARSIGVTAEKLQELSFAAGIGGVSQTQFVGGLQKLSRAAKEAGDGVATYKDTFDELGINVKDANGELKSSDVLFEELADSFEKLPDGTKKTALAMDLMGRSGAKMINVLNGGSSGLAKLREEARDSGFVISEADTVLSEEFNDSLERLTQVVKGFKNIIGVGLLRPIKDVVDGIRKWFLLNKDIIKQNLTSFVNGLMIVVKVSVTIFKRLFGIVNSVAQLFGGWGKIIKVVGFALLGLISAQLLFGIGQMASGIVGLIAGMNKLGLAATLTNAKMLAIPILIGAALVALGLVVEDIIAFFNGEDSVTGIVVEKFRETWELVKIGFIEFKDFLVSGFESAIDFIVSKFEGLGSVAQTIISVMLTPLRAAITTARTLGGVVGSLVNGDFSGALDAVKQGASDFIAPATDLASGGSTSLGASLGFGSQGVPSSASSVNNVSNKIEVNVPEGLNSEQAAKATQAGVKDAMATLLRETQRQVSTPIEE